MTHRWAHAALIGATVWLSGAPTVAQSKMDRATAAAEAAESPDRKSSSGETAVVTAMPAAPGEVVLGDAMSRRRYLEAMQRYYEYRSSGYAYRSRVFEWQLLSSRIIFAVVLTLVGAGIYFAAVQFRMAMRAPTGAAPASAEAAATAPVATLATQLELSAKGVVVNSSVIGLIILTLSLAFFYLYLVYVYPIENVF